MLDQIHDMVVRALEWVEGFASTPYGHWALFAISFAESSFFPIPPDILLIALCLGRPELAFIFALTVVRSGCGDVRVDSIVFAA